MDLLQTCTNRGTEQGKVRARQTLSVSSAAREGGLCRCRPSIDRQIAVDCLSLFRGCGQGNCGIVREPELDACRFEVLPVASRESSPGNTALEGGLGPVQARARAKPRAILCAGARQKRAPRGGAFVLETSVSVGKNQTLGRQRQTIFSRQGLGSRGGTVLSRAGRGGACRGVRRRREVRRLSKNEPRPAQHGQTSASGGTSSSTGAFASASMPASAFLHGPRVLAAERLFIFPSVGRVLLRTLCFADPDPGPARRSLLDDVCSLCSISNSISIFFAFTFILTR